MMDPTDQAMMLDVDNQIICRRKLDECRGNSWLCECPRCLQEKQKVVDAKR